MPWTLHTGDPAPCNRCRRPLVADERVFRGDVTKAEWCQPCAGESGVDGLPGVEIVERMSGLDKRALAAFAPDFTASMRALKARAAMKLAPERSWTGERE